MNLQMLVAVCEVTKGYIGQAKYFIYQVSKTEQSDEGWFKVEHRFQLAEFFDTFHLWGSMTYDKFSKNLQMNDIGLKQNFWVRFNKIETF